MFSATSADVFAGYGTVTSLSGSTPEFIMQGPLINELVRPVDSAEVVALVNPTIEHVVIPVVGVAAMLMALALVAVMFYKVFRLFGGI